jgi:hypothetical protein
MPKAPRFAHLGTGRCKRSRDGKGLHEPVVKEHPSYPVINSWTGEAMLVGSKRGLEGVVCGRCGAELPINIEDVNTPGADLRYPYHWVP